MQSLIFFGSDSYSALVLTALSAVPNSIPTAVVTDRAKEPTPVEKIAQEHNIKILYYPSNPGEMNTFIESLHFPDMVGLCASFDHLLSAPIIALFGGHLYNLHPSLLPQYRNVAPIQYAIALGDKTTGITLFKISEGIDNGEIITQASETIAETDTTPTLSNRLFPLGAQLFTNLLANDLRSTGTLSSSTNGLPLIFTHRLTRDSGHLEWSVLQKLLTNQTVAVSDTLNELLKLRLTHNPGNSLTILDDLLRALTPWPGIWSLAETKKGRLRISLESVKPEITVKLAGKPKAISWSDFAKYYLEN